MQISDDTRNVMEYLNEYSGNTLRSADKLSFILEILAGEGSFDLMNNMIFTGKSVHNLHNAIIKNASDNSQQELLKSEYTKSYAELTKLLSQILQLIPESDDREKSESLIKPESPDLIINLAHDLSILKDLQTLLKAVRK